MWDVRPCPAVHLVSLQGDRAGTPVTLGRYQRAVAIAVWTGERGLVKARCSDALSGENAGRPGR